MKLFCKNTHREWEYDCEQMKTRINALEKIITDSGLQTPLYWSCFGGNTNSPNVENFPVKIKTRLDRLFAYLKLKETIRPMSPETIVIEKVKKGK